MNPLSEIRAGNLEIASKCLYDWKFVPGQEMNVKENAVQEVAKALDAKDAQYDALLDHNGSQEQEIERLRAENTRILNWVKWAVGCMEDAGEDTSLLKEGKELLAALQSPGEGRGV